LIELIIVIAIIIILVSIAMPVYARFVMRAKRSNVAGDFRTLQNSVEAYRVDWGTYPVTGSTGETFGYHTDFTSPTSVIAQELTGENATLNISSHIDTLGEKGGIDYFAGRWIICRMRNPYNPAKDYEYYSQNGSSYTFACEYKYKGITHYILKNGSIYKDTTIKPVWYVNQ